MQNQDENFEALQRALKLKRHEQPPPGYYSNFSRQVIMRIRENDVHDRASVMDSAAWEAPWISRLLGYFQARPAYAGVFGAAACLLLVGGILYSERPSNATLTGGPRLGTPQNITGAGLLNDNAALVGNIASPSPLGPLPPGTTLFDQLNKGMITAPAATGTNLLK